MCLDIGFWCIQRFKKIVMVCCYRNVKDVKCIIFVQRRVAAVVLASLVNSLECLSKFFCGGWMSGSSLTREQQQRTLDAFREGKVEWASYPSEEWNHITWAWRCEHQQIGQIPFTNSQLSSPVVMIHMILHLLFLFFSWSSMLQRVQSFALGFKQHLCQSGRGNFSMTTRFCSDFVLLTLDRWIFWLLLMLQKKAWTSKAAVQSYVLTFQRHLAVLSNPVDEHDNMALLL